MYSQENVLRNYVHLGILSAVVLRSCKNYIEGIICHEKQSNQCRKHTQKCVQKRVGLPERTFEYLANEKGNAHGVSTFEWSACKCNKTLIRVKLHSVVKTYLTRIEQAGPKLGIKQRLKIKLKKTLKLKNKCLLYR